MTGSFKTDIHLTPKVVQLDHHHKYEFIQVDYESGPYYHPDFGWRNESRVFKRNETSGSILKFRNIINRYDDFESLIDATYMDRDRNYTLKSNLSHLNDETRLKSKAMEIYIGRNRTDSISLDFYNKLKDNGLSTFINTTYNDKYRSNYFTAELDYLPEMVDLKVEGL